FQLLDPSLCLEKIVRDVVPWSLLADPDVRKGLPARVGIEEAQPDADDVGIRFPTTPKRRAAATTKVTLLARRGLELGNRLRARDQMKVLRAHGRIGDEGSPLCLSAGHAMTLRDGT